MRDEGDRAEYSMCWTSALILVPVYQEVAVFVLVTQHVGADFLRTWLGQASTQAAESRCTRFRAPCRSLYHMQNLWRFVRAELAKREELESNVQTCSWMITDRRATVPTHAMSSVR